MTDLLSDLVFAESKLPKSVLKGELELYDCKWWDNRLFDPVTNTASFLRLFCEGRAHFTSRFRDRKLGEAMLVEFRRHVTGMSDDRKLLLPLSKSDAVTIWHARRRADKYGIPYDRYLTHYFDLAEKFGFKDAPPIAKSNIAKIGDQVAAQYAKAGEQIIHRPEHIFYRKKTTRNHPYARAWREALSAAIVRVVGSEREIYKVLAVNVTHGWLAFDEVMASLDPEGVKGFLTAFNNHQVMSEA